MAKRMHHPRDPCLATGRHWQDMLRKFREREIPSTSNDRSAEQVPKAAPEDQPRAFRPQTARRGRRFARSSAAPLNSRRSPPLYERRQSTDTTTSSAATEFVESTPPLQAYRNADEPDQNHRQDDEESHITIDSDGCQGTGFQVGKASGADPEGTEHFGARDGEGNSTEADLWTPPTSGGEALPRGRNPYFGLVDWDVTQTEDVVFGNLRRVERTVRMTLILEPWGWDSPRRQYIMWPSEAHRGQSHSSDVDEVQEGRSTSPNGMYTRREPQDQLSSASIPTDEEQPFTRQQTAKIGKGAQNNARSKELNVTSEGWYTAGVPISVVQQLAPRIWRVLRSGTAERRTKRLYKLKEGKFRVTISGKGKVTITFAHPAEGK